MLPDLPTMWSELQSRSAVVKSDLQRGAVEAVARVSGETRDEVRGRPPADARLDELGDRRERIRLGSALPLAAGADHERDLALREARRSAPRARRRSRERPPRSASSARGRRRPAARAARPASERRLAGSRRGDSNATAGCGQRGELGPERARAPSRRAAGTRGTGTARPTSPLATSAVSTADGPGSTVTGTPASSAAAIRRAPGSLTPGRPASLVERDPLAGLEPRQQLGRPLRLVVLVVAEQPRLDPVPLEQDLRPPRVLAEDEVRLRELAEHAQRDVLEVPDRRRADREQGPLEAASNPTKPGADRPASGPSCAGTIADEIPARTRAPRRRIDLPRGLEEEVARRWRSRRRSRSPRG